MARVISPVSVAGVAALIAAPVVSAQCPEQWYPGGMRLGIDGPVHTSKVWDPDGPGSQEPLLLFGGEFEYVAGLHAGGVAAWDGQQWSTLGDGPGFIVYSLATHNGQLIAAGIQHGVAPTACAVAAWDGSQWTLIGAGTGVLRGLASYAGDLYASGMNSLGGASTPSHVARLVAGTWQAAPFGATTGWPVDLQVHGNRLVVALSYQVVSWDGTTATDMPLDPEGWVQTLTEYAGSTTIGMYLANANLVQGWNGSAWVPVGGSFGAGHEGVSALGVHAGELYEAGAPLGSYIGPRFAVLRNGAWQSVASPGFGAAAETIQSYGGRLYVAGQFGSTPPPQVTNGMLSWDGNAWTPLLSGTLATFMAYPTDVMMQGEELWVCGLGTVQGAAGTFGYGVARRVAGQWRPVPSLPADFGPSAMAEFNGEVYLGCGSGTQFSGAGLLRWDGTAWRELPNSHYAARYVKCMTTFKGSLVASGDFYATGGRSTTLVRWDGSNWFPIAPLFSPPNAIHEHDGRLYAASAATGGTDVSVLSPRGSDARQAVFST
jgi:hypothetical protein